MLLLISCAPAVPGGSADVPDAILEPPERPELPLPGAPNIATARYLLATEEWMETAEAQILDLAEIICVFEGRDCPVR